MLDFHDFATRMQLDIARWRRDLVAAERAGFHGVAQTIQAWIAEGERLIAQR